MIYNWQHIVLLFFAMSVLGWAIEVVCKLVEFKRFINRGFLIGPYCPIYGVGSVLVILLLERHASSPFLLFLLTMFVCGTLEYLTSYGMEKLFHARWWDYSHKRFNIEGRVCASTLIPFGLLGLLLIYVIKPFLYRLFDLFPQTILTPLCIVLLLLLALDIAVSTTVLGKIRKSADLTGADDTETLTRAVRESLAQKSALTRRTLRAFPYARIYNHKLLAQLRLKKQQLMQENAEKKQLLRDELQLREQKIRAEIAAAKQSRKKTE